jgi:hypothetical protein
MEEKKEPTREQMKKAQVEKDKLMKRILVESNREA